MLKSFISFQGSQVSKKTNVLPYFSKGLRPLIVIFFLLIIMSGCKKDNTNVVSLPNDVKHLTEKSMSTVTTLTVNCLSNRTLSPGGTFTHQLILKSGTNPIANAKILIEDPINQQCTFVTTASNGVALWYRSTSSSTPIKLYSIRFFYGTTSVYSTVAIIPSSNFKKLSTYKVDINNACALSNSTLVASYRGGFQSNLQPVSVTLQQTMNLGVDIAKDVLSNPVTIGTFMLAALSCSYGELIPPAGQATCYASVQLTMAAIASSTAKVGAKYIIDKTTLPSTTKTSLKSIVDLTDVAISFSELDPAEGIKSLTTFSSIYTISTTNYAQLIYNFNGGITGASIAAPFGSNKVIMCSFVKH